MRELNGQIKRAGQAVDEKRSRSIRRLDEKSRDRPEPMESPKVTPMLQQYLQIKERYRDAILFFRLGDFYEMFFEDAQTASKVLDIALTSRNRNQDSSVPLCGVPYHSAEPYIQKLLDAGHKVAVCEQVEDPETRQRCGAAGSGVPRHYSREPLPRRKDWMRAATDSLCALCKRKGGFGLALTDITTGEFRCTHAANELSIFDELARIGPSELLISRRERCFRNG